MNVAAVAAFHRQQSISIAWLAITAEVVCGHSTAKAWACAHSIDLTCLTAPEWRA